MMKLKLILGAATLLAAGCAHDATTSEAPQAQAAQLEPMNPQQTYANVLAAPYRSDEDKGKDATRKPAETLQYMGIKPGQTVLELEAGGGYFTALLAGAVGENGHVYMQNPAAFDRFWGGGDPPRMKTLPSQVSYLRSDFDDLASLADASVDVVTWVQGPHELWYMPEGATEDLGEPTLTFKEIARVLKKGSYLVVQDHAAPAGSPESTGGDTHRVDQNHIDMLAASAGLTLVDASTLFQNADDDMTKNVFDPSIRGKTNQFFVRYQKQ